MGFDNMWALKFCKFIARAPSKFALVRKELLLTRCAEKWEMMIVKRGGGVSHAAYCEETNSAHQMYLKNKCFWRTEMYSLGKQLRATCTQCLFFTLWPTTARPAASATRPRCHALACGLGSPLCLDLMSTSPRLFTSGTMQSMLQFYVVKFHNKREEGNYHLCNGAVRARDTEGALVPKSRLVSNRH